MRVASFLIEACVRALSAQSCPNMPYIIKCSSQSLQAFPAFFDFCLFAKFFKSASALRILASVIFWLSEKLD